MLLDQVEGQGGMGVHARQIELAGALAPAPALGLARRGLQGKDRRQGVEIALDGAQGDRDAHGVELVLEAGGLQPPQMAGEQAQQGPLAPNRYQIYQPDWLIWPRRR